ncbi:hypothetical protein LPJ76_001288 [Coemansia sp. RSA 638]|nr:hypothetical protein LPJ76_001288 [Coemansia sp. RSA 638]
MASPSTIVRKHSLQKARWNPEYHQALEDYVTMVNYVTMHAYGLERTPFEQAIINELQPVLDSYDNDYEFAENSIYYDVKANPGKHLKAFIWLEIIFAEWGMSCTQALPLRSSWVYAHVPLNTAMLVQCVFSEPYNRISGGKEKIQPHINTYWKRAVDLQQDIFRSHGHYKFMGYMVTDGVSISAVRELVDEEPGGKKVCKEPAEKTVCKSKRGRPRKQAQPAQPEPVQPQQQADYAYIHDLSQATLQSTTRRCVLVDPGRRDMLYMMHEKSTVEDKKVYRYTQNQQCVETRRRKYQKILENEKPANIAAAERSLNAGSRVVPDLELFKDYLRARALVADDLTQFYNKTICHQRVGATTPEVPMHRKLRLSAYINRQRANQKLVSRLRKKFSPNAVFVMGNWSAPMARYHEPIRGKGWRTLLKRGGFTVYLINEYLTSFCPTCENRVSTFHYVPNPRPYRRTRQPMVKYHGLKSEGKWNYSSTFPAAAATAAK